MDRDINYILNHLGEERADYFNAVSPPIIQSSNFAFTDFSTFQTAIADERKAHIYSRGNNPTVEILRKKMAALENTEDALIFSSGSGAMSAAVLAFVKNGDHVICVRNPYSWTKALVNNVLSKFGITFDFVDGRNIENIAKAIRKETRLLILESPNTATFEIQDLEACSKIARENGIITLIDNSYCSPIFQNPHDFGIDLVMHSGTKYINGHSDVVCGILCGSKAHMDIVFQFGTMTLGNIISPNDAFLILRGMRTLPLRIKRSFETTLKIIEYLKEQPKVSQIFYPWDESFPQFPLVMKQMKGCGGLFSILLYTSEVERIEEFCKALKYFLFAVSWGGHESLILPFASLKLARGHEESTIPANLVRLYIGLEDADVLIQDLDEAFKIL